jgi:uncharacterized protein (TIGR00369 family)
MDVSDARALLRKMMSPWISALELDVESVSAEAVTLRLPFSAALRHAGGMIGPQVLMAAGETAMVLAIAALTGAEAPAAASIAFGFVRSVREGDLLVTGHVMRRTGQLLFGEIVVRDAHGEMIVHATATYMVQSQA